MCVSCAGAGKYQGQGVSPDWRTGALPEEITDIEEYQQRVRVRLAEFDKVAKLTANKVAETLQTDAAVRLKVNDPDLADILLKHLRGYRVKRSQKRGVVTLEVEHLEN